MMTTDAPMLLRPHTFDLARDTWVGGYFASQCIRGVRVFWNGFQLIAKDGRLVEPPSWWSDHMGSLEVDGVLFLGHDEDSVRRVRAVSETSDEDAWRDVKLLVIDMPTLRGDFHSRHKQTRSWFYVDSSGRSRATSTVWVIPQRKLSDDNAVAKVELAAELRHLSKTGPRSVMLREPGSYYHRGQSFSLLEIRRYP